MKRIKVLTIVGTRPEVIKLSRVVAELESCTDHVLVHTGQNFDYELNQIFFDELGISFPRYYLNAGADTPMATIARVLSASDDVLAEEDPDAVLLLGDTNSCLAAIAAKRRRIPIFHMEAGNRSFDQRIPEEANRKIVDHLSDINLPYTEHARRYLLAEGLDPARVIKTGSPVREVLDYHRHQIDETDVLDRLGLETGQYLLVSCHREENVDDPRRLECLLRSLATVGRHFEKPIVFSTHPRTRKRIESLDERAGNLPQVRFLKPVGFPDYVRLQMESFCVLSDSGSLTEEASLLDLPAVALREAHERPEGMDEGTVVMAGLRAERILQAVELVVGQRRLRPRALQMVEDYKPRNVSLKVARIIVSYVDYVRARVWQEPPQLDG